MIMNNGTGAKSRSQAEDFLCQGNDQWTQSTADVDADIEDRKRRIEARAALGI